MSGAGKREEPRLRPPPGRRAPDAPALRSRDLDALQEVASIGCGQALTALSSLLGRRLEMDVPEAWVEPSAGAVAEFLGSLGEDLVAVGVALEGLLCGHLILALPGRDAERLAAALGYPVPADGAWGPLAESAVLESGNIVGSAFVSAIARLVNGKLLLSVPTLVRGGGRECLDRLVDREEGRVALATRFLALGDEVLEGLILVMPAPATLLPLLASLDFA
ncbi:MAG TPA: chemotaxis protein CheC [Anaeromyxobacteraceae bacterium]|nr:chemotaxis protein CheC [Anaeromyxobacteraceae bacterium]